MRPLALWEKLFRYPAHYQRDLRIAEERYQADLGERREAENARSKNEGANKGILVTTSAYGSDAYDFCKIKGVELIDGSALLQRLEQVGVKAAIAR